MLWIAVCVAMMTVFLFLALSGGMGPGAAEKRLQRISGKRKDPEPKPKREATTTLIDEEGGPRNALARFVSRFASTRAQQDTGDRVYATVRQRLVEAGFRRSSSLGIYLGSRMAVGIGLAALTVVGSWSLGGQPSLPIIALGAAGGYLIPGIAVDRLRIRRQAAIQRGLPDVIDMMVVCVEAGLGLGATLARLADEFSDSEPALSHELRITVGETQAGRALMTALRSMAKRNGVQDLSTLVALLAQTERFGTPITQTLRAQAESMRFDRMQRAEEMAQKAPVKMMFPAGLIFLAILMILGGPAVMLLTRTLQG